METDQDDVVVSSIPLARVGHTPSKSGTSTQGDATASSDTYDHSRADVQELIELTLAAKLHDERRSARVHLAGIIVRVLALVAAAVGAVLVTDEFLAKPHSPDRSYFLAAAMVLPAACLFLLGGLRSTHREIKRQSDSKDLREKLSNSGPGGRDRVISE